MPFVRVDIPRCDVLWCDDFTPVGSNTILGTMRNFDNKPSTVPIKLERE